MFVGYRGQNILWAGPEKYQTSSQYEILETETDFPETNPTHVTEHYCVRQGRLIKKSDLASLPSKELRVAIVSQYGINCGIATYTKYLADEMRPLVKDLRILAEDADPEDCLDDARDNVVRCWKREGDYLRILKQAQEFEPDVIFIQHEYGSFSNGAQWNALVGHLSVQWRTIVVLHSVYQHPDKLIFESPCHEIIVHSGSGRDLLKQRGITHAPISHVPHGCMDPIHIDVKFSKIESKHAIFQYGFGYEYKGWENAIAIVEILSKRYPDLIYNGVFNVSKFSESFNNQYYDKLMQKVRDKNLEKHFVLHKGFRSEPVLLSYMAQSQVNLFPYWNHPEWRVHGASGAVRLALASGTPTIAGDVPFFSEFKGHIPVCNTIQEYVDTIVAIFEDPEYRASVVASTQRFIEGRTWKKIAQWYLEVKPGQEFIAI